MRPTSFVFAIASILAIAGCSAQSSDSGSSSEQAVESSGSLVQGADRGFSFSYSGTLESWGKGLWEGYMSFDAVASGTYYPTYDQAFIVDGTGAQYPIKSSTVHFDRLPLPVSLVTNETSGGYGNNVTLSKVQFEVTKTNPIPADSLSGKFNLSRVSGLTTVGSDIPGVTLTFAAHAEFYRNFTNGNACSRLVLVDAQGHQEALDASRPSAQLALVAPVQVDSQATCISSRLASGENADADFDLDLTSISLGNPQ